MGDTPRFCSNCGAPLTPAIDPVSDSTIDGPSPTANPQSGSASAPGSDEDRLSISNAYRISEPVIPVAQFDPDVTMPPNQNPKDEESSSDNVGKDLGRFKLGRVLGAGGMGTVFEATDRGTGQKVALKLLSRHLRGTDETVQRFQRESQIAASINHPRSTFVYESGQQDDQIYITMELMDGGTLKDVVEKEGGLSVKRAVDYILDVVSGLQVAHEAGVVHRDLKPSNCFIDDDGRAKVGDFGLSKSFLSDSSLTQTGTFMGTPQYAAPEQLRAAEVGAKADIYALGGTLFYLLTGRAPFVGNAAQVISSIATDEPPNVKTIKPEVPKQLAALIHQTLEKDPGKRPANLEQIRLALRPFSSRGAVESDTGLRLAAFFIDFIVASFVGALCSFPVSFLIVLAAAAAPELMAYNIAAVMFAQVLAYVGYFFVAEYKWGTTLGKWMFGLRVINDANETPTAMQSLARSAMIPGLQQIIGVIPAYWMQSAQFSGEMNSQGVYLFILSQLIGFVAWLPNFICASTIRRSNGYRGLHEFCSGTRVVRLSGSLESGRPTGVANTASIILPEPHQQIGDYSIVGAISKASSTQPDQASLFLGLDRQLNRDVWIVETEASSVEQPVATAAIRPTRLRTIAEHRENNRQFRVTEAIAGAPLLEFIRTGPTTQWSSFRPVLRELTYEFKKSIDEGSLPNDLSLSNIWINRSGRTKLLAHAVPTLAPPATTTESNSASKAGYQDLGETTRATPHQLIQKLLDEVIDHHPTPSHVVQFRNTIDPETQSPSLESIGKTLGEFANRPSAWTWIDKLGVVATFLTIEFSPLTSLGIIWAMVASNNIADITPTQVAVLFGAGSMIAVLISAYLSGGGVALKASNVVVCNKKDLTIASVPRLLLRTFATWLLPIAFIGSTIWVLSAVTVKNMFEDGMAVSNIPSDQAMVISTLIMFAVGMLGMLSLVISVCRPSRGVADLIAGTCLMRK